MKFLIGHDEQEVAWWPPKVGDKLRYLTHHATGDGRVKQVLAHLHVVSVFDHDGGHIKVCVAEWLPTPRRWKYEVHDILGAHLGEVWPDGTEPPGQYNTRAREIWARSIVDSDTGTNVDE